MMTTEGVRLGTPQVNLYYSRIFTKQANCDADAAAYGGDEL